MRGCEGCAHNAIKHGEHDHDGPRAGHCRPGRAGRRHRRTDAGPRYVAFALPGERVRVAGDGLPELLSAPSPIVPAPLCRPLRHLRRVRRPAHERTPLCGLEARASSSRPFASAGWSRTSHPLRRVAAGIPAPGGADGAPRRRSHRARLPSPQEPRSRRHRGVSGAGAGDRCPASGASRHRGGDARERSALDRSVDAGGLGRGGDEERRPGQGSHRRCARAHRH